MSGYSSEKPPEIQRRTVSRQAAAMLRDFILTGQLEPGTRIVQTDWASRLGVSRMPVRDAINELTREGTLIQSGSGTAVVAEIDPRDIRDGYELNAIISSLAAHRAAKLITAENLKMLEALHAELAEAVKLGDQDRASELNWRFHRQINLASGSARLIALLRMIAPSIPHSAFEMIEEWPRRAVEDHDMILDALRSHDAERAAALVHAHIQAGSEHMLADLESRFGALRLQRKTE